jgi:tRNA(Arg) A34 adenosine deaminase TadA
MDDTQAMERCLALAQEAVEAGDEPYGSVILRDGALLAEGRNHENTDLDPTAHAETVAVRAACRAVGSLDLSGSTLYASFEPCAICALAIRRTGIARVVIAASGSDVGGYTSKYAILRDPDLAGPPPPKVELGLMADRSAALIREAGGWRL